jgi:hypothetical protein
MAQGQLDQRPPGDPAVGGGAARRGGGGGAIGGMPPMDPMQGAGVPGGEKAGSYKGNGVSFDTSGIADMFNKASAIARLRRSRGAA